MVAALVGRPDQARKQVEQGVDIVVAQGTEAGGHTGEIATMVLVPEVVEAVAPTPVLAAGGIGSGRQMAAVDGARRGGRVDRFDLARCRREQHRPRRHGASVRGDRARRRAVPFAHRQARADAAHRVDGGVGARRLPGHAADAAAVHGDAEGTRAHRALDRRDLFGMPVGQIVGSMDHVQTSKQVVLDMVQEYIDTVEKMSGDLGGD